MKSLLTSKTVLAAVLLATGAFAVLSLFSQIDLVEDPDWEDDQAYGDPDGETSDGDVASFVD